jgi:hypothetical protein
MEQLKPDKRYLLATQEDINLNISLKTNFNDLNEFKNSKLISLTELFNEERNKSSKYRIYGNINCVSFLTNKKTTQTGITDFFNDDYKQTGFNFEDFFDLKIFKQTINQYTAFNSNDTYIQHNIAKIENKNPYASEKNFAFETNSLKLYPNPVLNVFNVKVDSNLINQPYNVVDGSGRVVLTGKLNDVETSINVEQLSKGIYYLKLSDSNASKFIKE